MPVFSSGETNASIRPSVEMAMGLTSPGTGIANSNLAEGLAGRRATDQVTAATAISARAAGIQSLNEIRLGVSRARVNPLASVPESAPKANERSRADWKRCSGFFSRHLRTIRSRAGE